MRALTFLARRFVAGDTIEDALVQVRRLNAEGLKVTLDYLGEECETREQAEQARDEYRLMLRRIAETGADCNVSLKLTQFGLNLDQALARDNLAAVAREAQKLGNFVRIDMEGSPYTQLTLDLFYELFPQFPNMGVVLQAYLRRSLADAAECVRRGVRVRLCKGAYKEPPDVAFETKAEVDRSFAALMERLLLAGTYPAIATHDVRLIRRAIALAREHGIGADRFEFQMLYGVRRDLQERLVAAGWRVRVYVPYGTEWYPYFMRRLAERPANVLFLLRSLAREAWTEVAPRPPGR